MAGNATGAKKAAETRKRNKGLGLSPKVTSAAEPEPRPARTVDDDDPLGPRVVVPLTADGAIAWANVPASQIETVRAAIAKEAPQSAAGDLFTDETILGMLFDTISSVAVSLARAAGYSASAAAVMRFNEDEKRGLVPLAGKVLAKYSSALGKYQDEILLLGCAGMTIAGKLQQLRASEPLVSGAGSNVSTGTFGPS